MPKHPQGKAAGVACLHLLVDWRCELFGSALRPAVCGNLQPAPEMCGEQRADALVYLQYLEQETKP